MNGELKKVNGRATVGQAPLPFAEIELRRETQVGWFLSRTGLLRWMRLEVRAGSIRSCGHEHRTKQAAVNCQALR